VEVQSTGSLAVACICIDVSFIKGTANYDLRYVEMTLLKFITPVTMVMMGTLCTTCYWAVSNFHIIVSVFYMSNKKHCVMILFKLSMFGV